MDNYFTLYIVTPLTKQQEEEYHKNYYAYLEKLEKESKHICPNCKKLYDELFRLRLQNLNQISQDLLGIYELPPKDRKNEK